MKLVGNILYVFVIVALLAVAGLFVVSLLPIPGNVEIKIVKSGSMEPTIMTGSVVVIKPESAYAVGDIITFGEDSKTQIPTTHRIVASRTDAGQNYFITKGDANEDPDADETPQGRVIGRVLFSAPYVGYILDFARHPYGFALMIGVPAVVIIGDESLKIVREVVALRRKKKIEVAEKSDDRKILHE